MSWNFLNSTTRRTQDVTETMRNWAETTRRRAVEATTKKGKGSGRLGDIIQDTSLAMLGFYQDGMRAPTRQQLSFRQLHLARFDLKTNGSRG